MERRVSALEPESEVLDPFDTLTRSRKGWQAMSSEGKARVQLSGCLATGCAALYSKACFSAWAKFNKNEMYCNCMLVARFSNARQLDLYEWLMIDLGSRCVLCAWQAIACCHSAAFGSLVLKTQAWRCSVNAMSFPDHHCMTPLTQTHRLLHICGVYSEGNASR